MAARPPPGDARGVGRRCSAAPGRLLNCAPRVSSQSVKTAAHDHPTQANAERRYTVTRADLPLSCPLPSMALWNSHPRVYLPIEATGSAKCPYCGAVFVLEG